MNLKVLECLPVKAQELVQRSGFDRTASAFSSAPLDNPTADHQVLFPVYWNRDSWSVLRGQ
ncbi:hypothetical protein F2Q69_00024991 [Brassica cretica]|uniref:Uncharacterized protein n=1 Tax=Brassica cretica TaxID=69181 RepID=A0A8S9QIU0_BRACR|nr:hypothetical protein F2Q69_00024991 [Brassica cretica]